MRGGGQRPFGIFLKIHPFWWGHLSLSGMWYGLEISVSTSSVSNCSFTFGRFGCAVVAHQGRIYVSGGFGQDKVNI